VNMTEDAVGRQGRVTCVVERSQSANAYGNPDLWALATPALVGLMEMASMDALDGLLQVGERSVGSVVEVEHRAPTPVGARVDVVARIDEVDGRKVWFSVTASDQSGTVAAGRHARVVVDDARFRARLAELDAGLRSSRG